MEITNKVRGYAFIFCALRGQQTDPFCGSCNSYVKVLTAAREGTAALESEHGAVISDLPEELTRLFADAKEGLSSLRMPAQTVGQKKAGNCKLPEGICFLKSSLALVQKI
jgi:hypothetical protein